MSSLSSLFLTRTDLAWRKDFFASFPEASFYIVGGAVRDALLLRPIKDLDLIVAGVPVDTLSHWLETHGKTDLVGRDFGVFKFTPEGETTVLDIALPRTEKPLPDSRGGFRDFAIQADPLLPIEKDLARRDFTVNAFAFDLKEETFLDPFEGKRDLETKVLRTVGAPEERFKEDKTRLLRAIRFAVELNFTIEEHTWGILVDLARTLNDHKRDAEGRDVWVVPREVVAKELGKALLANPERTLSLLAAAGCRDLLLPESNALPPSFSSSSLAITLAALWQHAGPKTLRRLAPPFGRALDEAEWILTHAPLLKDPETMRASVFEKHALAPESPLLLAYLEAIHDPRAPLIETRAKAMRARWYTAPGERIRPLLSGTDLLEAGVPSGPKVRLLLEKIRDLQLEGDIRTREEARDALTQLLPRT